MNFITIAGNLGKDAELRHIPSGESVLSFSVADSLGRDKPTIWWNCSLWGKRAEALGQYLTKGAQVTVVGTVVEREWEKDGQTRKSMDVRVQDIKLQGGKPEGGERPAQRQQAPRQERKPEAAASGSGFDDMDDDIPF